MAGTIKFDGVDLLTTDYNPRFIKHESSPDIQLDVMDLANEDGAVQISDRTGSKIITTQGILVGTSESDLEAKIDAFKELFRRVNKVLYINWNGTSRQYIASCRLHSFDRDHFNIGYVPWTAEFLVPTGIAEASTESNLEGYLFTTWEYDATALNFLGSAPPLPRISVTGYDAASSNALGIEIKNTDTGERMVYTRAGGITQNIPVVFDCRLKTVAGDIAPSNYYGVFPKFLPGIANNLHVRVGDIIAESHEISDMNNVDAATITSTRSYCESVILPFADATFRGIELYIRKSGSPSTDLVCTIMGSDASGNPYGTIATMTIDKSLVSNSAFGWVRVNSAAAFTLNANTKYWIFCSTTGASNYYWLRGAPPFNQYKRGGMAFLEGGIYTYENDYPAFFRLLFGGKQDLTKSYYLLISYFKRWL